MIVLCVVNVKKEEIAATYEATNSYHLKNPSNNGSKEKNKTNYTLVAIQQIKEKFLLSKYGMQHIFNKAHGQYLMLLLLTRKREKFQTIE